MIEDRLKQRVAHILAILAVAIVLKVYFFNRVGVFGDFGYWAYDSRMIMNGLTPFVDFPGRSPLMVYLLAVVRTAVGDVLGPLVTLRATVVALWLLTTIPVYVIANWIHGHRAGLIAMLAFTSAPFALVYGMWLNSQALGAVLSVTAVAVILQRVEERWAFWLAGSLLGAAFLARRATIVLLGAIGLWAMWWFAGQYDWRRVEYWRLLIGRGIGMAVAFALTMGLGYFAVANGDWQLGWQILNIDFLGLFQTGGRGAYPVVGVESSPPAPDVKGGGLPVINHFCPGCGAWTARRGLKILILSTPVAGLYACWVRDWVAELYSERMRMYLLGVFGPLLLYATYLSIAEGYPYRVTAIVAFVMFGVAAWHGPRLSKRVLYHPGMRFLLIMMSLLIVSYLARNRRIIVYYMMDNWAYMSIAASVLGVALWDRAGRGARVVLVFAIILGVVSAGMIAAPLGNLSQTGFLTISSVGAIGDDIGERTAAGDRVLSPHPTFVAGSDAQVYDDNPRIYMTVMLFDDGEFAQRQRSSLSGALSNGEIEYVIETKFAKGLLTEDGIAEPFNTSYCPIAAPEYAHENATLYQYRGEKPCQ